MTHVVANRNNLEISYNFSSKKKFQKLLDVLQHFPKVIIDLILQYDAPALLKGIPIKESQWQEYTTPFHKLNGMNFSRDEMGGIDVLGFLQASNGDFLLHFPLGTATSLPRNIQKAVSFRSTKTRLALSGNTLFLNNWMSISQYTRECGKHHFDFTSSLEIDRKAFFRAEKPSRSNPPQFSYDHQTENLLYSRVFSDQLFHLSVGSVFNSSTMRSGRVGAGVTGVLHAESINPTTWAVVTEKMVSFVDRWSDHSTVFVQTNNTFQTAALSPAKNYLILEETQENSSQVLLYSLVPQRATPHATFTIAKPACSLSLDQDSFAVLESGLSPRAVIWDISYESPLYEISTGLTQSLAVECAWSNRLLGVITRENSIPQLFTWDFRTGDQKPASQTTLEEFS